MFRTLIAATATLALFSGVPAYAASAVDGEVILAATGSVTADQAGRIVMQEGQAIGTLTEVSEEDNLAVISLMDGSEKQVPLTELVVADDGSIELAAADAVPTDEPTYQ